jgi:hypothetical protein
LTAPSSTPGIARCVGLLAGLGALAAGLETTACDDAYSPPCRTARDEVIAEDPAIGMRPTLVRSRSRVTASWPRREPSDAGGNSIGGFEVVVLDERGAPTKRANIAAPERLRARLDGVAGAGVVLEDSATLVWWIETTTSTDDRGRSVTDAALHAAYVREGIATEVTLPPSASCERCAMTTAIVELGDEAVVFVRAEPQPVPGVLAPSTARFAAVRLRSDGFVADEPVPWLGTLPPRPLGGVGVVAAVAPTNSFTAWVDPAGRIGVATKELAWLVDAELRPTSGPIVLPASSAVRVSWNDAPAKSEASIVWSASPFDDGRATEADVVSDVFLGFAPSGAGGIATRERLSTGRGALAVVRSGDEVATLFDSASRRVLALSDPRGAKRGGDVILPSAAAAQGGAGAQTHEIFANGGGKLTAIAFGAGELRVTEIVCAP